MRALVAAIATALSLSVAAQETGVLRITVTVAEANGTDIPIPRAQLLISDNPTTKEPRRVRTGAGGTIEVTLPAGNYTVESDAPVNFGGRNFSWTQMLDVAAGKETVLALTAANAEIELAAGTVTGAGAATHGDSAALFNKWHQSVAEIWTPSRHATGFVIDARGLIATNDRTLGEAADVEVEFGNAAERIKVAGRVIAADRTKGVAIVWIDPDAIKSRPPIAPSCAAADRPAIAHDDRVIALIAPILEPKSAVPGTAVRPDAQSFRADWRLEPGSTGGPVFDADGSAIGITVAEDEQQSTGRRADSYVIPLHNACSVIAAAEQKMAGAKPPAGTALRTEMGLPRPRVAKLGEAQAPRQQPPMIRADDFDITLMTPAMITHDQSIWSPRSYFGYWSPYVANAPEVLFVRTTPQFEESFWKMLARGAASTQGVALPPMPSFAANFQRMRAFCGEAEVPPIRNFTVEMPVEKGGRIREGLYVFAPTDFGSQCGTVRFELFSEKSPNRGDSRTIDPEVFTKLAGAR